MLKWFRFPRPRCAARALVQMRSQRVLGTIELDDGWQCASVWTPVTEEVALSFLREPLSVRRK